MGKLFKVIFAKKKGSKFSLDFDNVFSSKLKKFKNLKHCFFSRQNGFSKGYYNSLNCGLGSKDEKENVLKILILSVVKWDVKMNY